MNLMIVNDGSSTTAPVAMTLAAIAYADPSDIPRLLVDPTLATQRRWQLRWLGRTDANQVYIAQDQQTQQFAVSIRGTVTDPLSEAFWINWFKQDLAVLQMEAWPYGGAPSGARIAGGTLDGLKNLIRLTNASGQTMVDFLQANLSPGVSPLTGVVGHSLGGALASGLAPYLHQQLLPSQPTLAFWPVTFAGPTAGNGLFAGWLEQQFAASRGRYFNTLDVVPHSWQALAWIANSFPNGGPHIPPLLADSVKVVEGILKLLKDNYVQSGAGMPLPSTIQPGDNWFTEAGYQHSSKTYLTLLGAPPVPITGHSRQ